MSSVRIKIHFYQGDKLLKKIAFQQGQHIAITIGKFGNKVDVELNSAMISRQHGQLIFTSEAELFYVDLGSTNGSFHNRNRIQPNDKLPLSIGDKLQLTKDGEFYFEVVHPDEKAKVTVSVDAQIHNLEQTDIIDKFKQTNVIIIGRAAECDVHLNAASISRQHCQIERLSDGTYELKDLGSTNGTFINGQKLRGSKKISEDDHIIVGRFILSLRGKARNLGDETAIRLDGIVKQYPNGYVGLHETSISIPSKSLLAVMGPSGCGKSTLLKALCGEAPPSKGKVFLFEQELVSNYEYLKTQIGYVPQDDIVHRQLTVSQSLYFAAKLRLESPSPERIAAKVQQVLKDLNIIHIKDNLVSKISGGQRKRVSIAVEMLTDPLILFLDEPTSPLDPQTIEEFLGILKTLADRGTTVVMVTHKPEDLDYMDEVIFMAEGGHMVYHGDAEKYQNYFNVKNPVRAYMAITGKDKQQWIDKFKKANPTKGNVGNATQDIRKNSNSNAINQWYWLTARALRIKMNDRSNAAFLIFQAPIIAALICLIFKEISLAVPFLMAISAVWFGVNNSAREIVSELPIYTRERMFNISLTPYILSKITVFSILSLVQSALFVAIISLKYSSGEASFSDPIAAFVWMFFLSISATLLGLVLSALMSSTEKVMTVVPMVLIPQILLAGFVAKISNPVVEYLSYITLSRWGTEGFTAIQGAVMTPVPEAIYAADGTMTFDMQDRVQDGIETLHQQFHEATFSSNFGDMIGSVELDFIAVGVWSAIFFIGIFWALKRKDSIPRKKEK